MYYVFVFFKQKTAYEMRISDWSSDVCSSDLLFQIAEDRIQKIDPQTGRVLATIPAPGGGGDTGLAWAEGTLWVGQHQDGRASCRERGWQDVEIAVVAESIKKKKKEPTQIQQ